ncbi:MAG: nucleotidyltransferase family protein [Marinibacterium sp.]|nr:nucleotidyltransferase family protein [Marinibacterium sp.]
MTVTCPILLLAAGGSTRMGGTDKLMCRVDGQPLIRRQAQLARGATDGAVIVALPSDTHPRWQAIGDLDVTRLAVPDAAEGMNASLRRGIAALPQGSDAVMVLLGDLPDLTPEDLATMMAAVDPGSDVLAWRGTTQDGAPGHPVIFRAPLFTALMALRGDGGGREALATAGGRIALIPLPGTHARTDLDTPEAWAAWRARNPDR